jgi:hypothetical protein
MFTSAVKNIENKNTKKRITNSNSATLLYDGNSSITSHNMTEHNEAKLRITSFQGTIGKMFLQVARRWQMIW